MARRTKAQMQQAQYEAEVDKYEYYVVELATEKVIAGYEYRDDAEEQRLDHDIDEDCNDLKQYKTVSKKALERMGINNPNEAWKAETIQSIH